MKTNQQSSRQPPRQPRRTAIIGFDGIQALDVVGPMEVFAKANQCKPEQDPGYELFFASPAGGTLHSTCGLQLAESIPLAALPPTLDTFIIAGGSEDGLRRAAGETAIVEWVQTQAAHSRRIASVCTGAFVLGAAGLLYGKKVTTHWTACDTLQQMWPDSRVDPKAIYVADPPIYSSAGVSTGVDLCLSLVAEDCGAATVFTIAQELVLFMHRLGNQTQYSHTLSMQAEAGSTISRLLTQITDNPRGDLSIPALAERVNMSERTFIRRFHRETGITPAKFVQKARLERAKHQLITTRHPLAVVATQAGFSSLDSLHRCFMESLELTPALYRKLFGQRPDNSDREQ